MVKQQYIGIFLLSILIGSMINSQTIECFGLGVKQEVIKKPIVVSEKVVEVKEQIKPTSFYIASTQKTALPTLTKEEKINNYIKGICRKYNVEPELVQSIVWHESGYKSDAKNGDCLGLMQISTRWNVDRAKRLGVVDLYDPYSNILVGVDLLSELFLKYKDKELVLMLYSMNHNSAFALHKQGKVTKYVTSVLSRCESLKKEVAV